MIDGKTLEHVLKSPTEPLLAQLGSLCGSVVICRASPSQKAAIVKMMTEYEVHILAALPLTLLPFVLLQLLLLLWIVAGCMLPYSQMPYGVAAVKAIVASVRFTAARHMSAMTHETCQKQWFWSLLSP